MRIKAIHVKNFRCLKDVFVPCDALTVLVGPNGTGKSCLIRVLHLFYNTNIKVEERDYYDNDVSQDISITVHFTDLSDLEKKTFEPYLEGDEISVEKVIKYTDQKPIQKYFGTRYKNPEFEAFRNASGSNLRAEYEKLRQKEEYKAFPSYRNKDEAQKILEDWELTHKDKCGRSRDDGQFFGFQNVGMYRLEKNTKFILIPAVQEASEECIEQRGSIFEEIMGIVVKSAMIANEDIVKLQTEAEQRYRELIDPAKNENLKNLQATLTSSLNYFVPDSGVSIKWIEESGVQINAPRAYVTLREGGYDSTVDRCGHGLQRAYILSLFQTLAFTQASISMREEEENQTKQLNLPSLIIGIEEPELYQHPDRQRHFARILMELCSKGISGTFGSVQAIYSTHSPLMIDYERFNQLRIFRKKKAQEENKPKESDVRYTDLAQVSRFVEKAKDLQTNTINEEDLRQRLIPLMNPWMNEGFFASLVVLVEGIKDRALILGEALSRDKNIERLGICVVPCSGKDSMTEAIAIFNCLKIPTYVIWDSDEGKQKGVPANRNILRCHGCEPEDYSFKITDDFCCVKTNLEQTFREEIGMNDYNRILTQFSETKGLGEPSHAMENPVIVSELLLLLKTEGYFSKTLREIVERIIKKYNAVEKT